MKPLLGKIIRFLGLGLVFIGIVFLTQALWELWGTDIGSNRDASQAVSQFISEESTPPSNSPKVPKIVTPGKAYALVRIPRFGDNYVKPLYQGTDLATLARGLGRYTETSEAGEIGNFAIAGHRTTHGKPLGKIAQLRRNDLITVQTHLATYIYRVTATEIVPPDRVSVLLPVPNRPGVQPTKATLTLTSCHPEYSSRERYVVYAELV